MTPLLLAEKATGGGGYIAVWFSAARRTASSKHAFHPPRVPSVLSAALLRSVTPRAREASLAMGRVPLQSLKLFGVEPWSLLVVLYVTSCKQKANTVYLVKLGVAREP